MGAIFRRDLFAAWAAVFAIFTMAGCGGLVGNPNPPKDTGDEKSAIHISLTDAPIDDAKHLYINISRFALWHEDTGAWIDVQLSVDMSIDILELQGGKTVPLGFHTDIPVGLYTKILMAMDPQNPPLIVYKDGREETLQVLAEDATTEHDIYMEVEPGQTYNYTLDFDVRRSIVPADRTEASPETMALLMAEPSDTVMNPTLRWVNDATAGVITGEGDVGDVVCVYEVGTLKDEDDLCLGSINSGIVQGDGTYRVPFIPEGSYAVRHFKMDDFIDKDDVEVQPATAEEDARPEPMSRQPLNDGVDQGGGGSHQPSSRAPETLEEEMRDPSAEIVEDWQDELEDDWQDMVAPKSDWKRDDDWQNERECGKKKRRCYDDDDRDEGDDRDASDADGASYNTDHPRAEDQFPGQGNSHKRPKKWRY